MRPRCFAEFPAGLASVSLRLHGGPGCRPPISRMGNKAGYAETILWTLGLTAGKSAGAYVWAEADDDVRALLRAYPDPALLLQIAAIIRGWADEEPRALWERLRAERKARIGPDGIARHLHLTASNRLIPGAFAPDGRWVNAARDGGPETLGGASFGGPEFATEATATATATATASLAEFAMLSSSNRLINVAGPDLRNTGKGGTTFGGAEFATPAVDVAGAFEAASACCSYDTRVSSNWPPVAVLPRIPSAADLASWLGTPGDLDGVVVYMDPPYVDTIGYMHNLSRAEVVSTAIEFASMGAHVAISEAVALPELMALGWYASEITGGRKGQKRTFSKQQAEILTMNRPAAYSVPVALPLFGGEGAT